MSYIPHTGEAFVSIISPRPALGESAIRYWVGVEPRLEIRDEDSGYARLTTGTTFSELVEVVAYLAPFNLNNTARGAAVVPGYAPPFLIDLQIRYTGDYSGSITASPVSFGVRDSEGEHFPFASDADAPTGMSVGSWHNLVVPTYVSSSDYAALAAFAAAGQVYIASTFAISSVEGYDLSFIGLRGGDIPTRVYPRADGLGMGAPRLMDGRSPYRSPRVFGTI